MILEHKYNWAESEVSDINEHIPTLKKYAEGCDTVIEMGVRTIVSTWGLLAAKPKKLISIDLYPPHLYGGDVSEGVGLQQAIDEFLTENPHWVVEKVFTNNNGLTILKRTDDPK